MQNPYPVARRSDLTQMWSHWAVSLCLLVSVSVLRYVERHGCLWDVDGHRAAPHHVVALVGLHGGVHPAAVVVCWVHGLCQGRVPLRLRVLRAHHALRQVRPVVLQVRRTRLGR